MPRDTSPAPSITGSELRGRVVVGTSSWADPGFVQEWYPARLAARERLAWYAEHFEAVEVNSTFYGLPAERTVERWGAVTPEAFTFDVKAHRLLSRHSASLESLPHDLRRIAVTDERGRVALTEELEQEVARALMGALTPLAEAGKLSTVLVALSPAFAPASHQLDGLTRLVDALGPGPVAIEFRHRGWVEGECLEQTLTWLEDHGAVLVCVDSPPGRAPTMMPAVDAVTHPHLAYLRAHGRNAEGYLRGRTVAERFGWDYSDEELGELTERLGELAGGGRDVRMMFNNNRGADAPHAAQRMREVLGQRVPSTSGPATASPPLPSRLPGM